MSDLAGHPTLLARDAAGVFRIAGTRVSLGSVVSSYRAGSSTDELLEGFPDLSRRDMEVTISFYLERRLEVEEYLAARSREAQATEERIREEYPDAYRRVAPPEEAGGREP